MRGVRPQLVSSSAVLISLLFFIPVAAASGDPPSGMNATGETGPPAVLAGDLVISGDETLICPVSDYYNVDGNVIVKSGATATLVACKLNIIQDPGEDHNIIIEHNATFLMSASSELTSNDPLDVIGTRSAKFEASSSKILLAGGSISGSFGSGIQIRDSEVSASTLTAMAAVEVMRSTLSVTNVVLQISSVWEKVTLEGGLEVTGGFANLTDTTFQGINVSGTGEARLYRSLEVSVADGLSVSVLDAGIEISNREDTSVRAPPARPIGNGRWMLSLMSDIINASTPTGHYVGNWFVNVTMDLGSSDPVKKPIVVSVPKYSHVDQQFTNSQPVNFREVQMPSSLPNDFVVEAQDEVIRGFGSTAPFLAEANIRVKPGRTLTLGPNAHIQFSDNSPGRSIVVEGGATLILNGSKLEGNLAIYVEAGAKIVGTGLVSDGGLGALGGEVDVKDVELRGGVGGTFGSFKAQRFKVGGQTNASASEFGLTSVLFGAEVTLNSTNIEINGVSVTGQFRIEGFQGPLKVESLTYKSVSIAEGVTLLRHWKLRVVVLNGGNRAVQDANVSIEPLHLFGVLLGPKATGFDGATTLSALGEIVTQNASLFVGNYRIQVIYERNGEKHVLDPPATVGVEADIEVAVKFDQDFVPPLYLSTQPIVRSEYEPGQQVQVDGTLFYNGGSDPVVGAVVTLTLVESQTMIGTMNTTSTGSYHFIFNAPPIEGTYTLRISARDNATNLSVTVDKKVTVKRGETFQLTVLLFAVGIVAAIVSLWAVSRYRKWQDFKRDARDNPLFKGERHFDEVERQLRTELARELHGRPTRSDGQTLLSGEVSENGRGKRKRGGGLLGTDGGSDARSPPQAATGKVSSLASSVMGMVRRP